MAASQKDILCLKDPNWRLNNLYYITDKNKNKILFKKNSIQQTLHDTRSRFDVILKARQVGISTYYLLSCLDQAAFNPNQTIAILSHDRESLRKLFKIIRYAHKFMHPLVQPILDRGGGSQYRLYFPEINSEIYCTLEAVSDAISRLHISEMALNENPDAIRTSMDSVPIGSGSISIETTARGYNHFYKFWNNNTGYKKFFFPWYMHDEYKMHTENIVYTPNEVALIDKAKQLFGVQLTKEQIAFRRFKISQKDSLESFLQEYPEDDVTCFLTSGNAACDLIKIKKLIDAAKDPISHSGSKIIYEKFDKKKLYVAGADTAEGVNKDYSVCCIFETKTRKLVAKIRSNNWRPREFAKKAFDLCKEYSFANQWPLLAVELNNHGHAVLLELEEHLHYKNLYRYKPDTAGWKTDSLTRPLMVDTFIDALENETIEISDKEVLGECLTLIDNNGKIEAQDGENDDTIIACAIAVQMFKEIKVYNDNFSETIKFV